MDNRNHQQCVKLNYLNSKSHIEYDQRQQGGSSNNPPVRSPPTSPGVPQVARRVQDETDETININTNNFNNNDVTYYSDSIASSVFLCILSSSLLAPYQHEISRASKARLIDEFNISYKYQFIIGSAETKHVYGILKMFTAIKYFPKNYKGIIILGNGVTKLKIHGIGTIAVEIQNKLIELHYVLYVPHIAYTLYSIIEHSRQPGCSFFIENGATTVGFPTFTLLENTHKEITLDAYLPFKEQHSQPDYTNLPNDFKTPL